MLNDLDYWIQVMDDNLPWGPGSHMRIRRHDNEPIVLGWDDLQWLVREYMNGDSTVVEFFPVSQDVVNDVNMRHFWTVNLQPPM